MKNVIAIITISFLFASSIYAQKALSIQGEKVKDGVIYLTFDGITLKYYTSDKNQDHNNNVNESMTFALIDDNSCDIYLKWVNPLRYKITWEDTTYFDQRDKAVTDFVTLLVSQFGSPVTSLNKTENSALAEKSIKTKGVTFNTAIDTKDLTFNNTDLTLLYILLHSYQGKINPEFNSVTDSLKKLDSLISINISIKVDLIFSELLSLNDPTIVLTTATAKETQIKYIEDLYKEIKSVQESITKALSDLTITEDALYNNYTKTVISKFIDQSSATLNSNKNLTIKLKPVVDLVKNSVNNESSIPATKGFCMTKSVEFEDGSKLQTSLTITEFEYKKDTKEFVKKNDVLRKSLIFQKYDFIAISVSTGLFYSSSTLKGYGVSNNGSGQFTVTEDDFTKSSTAPALFLNFNFGVGSRYFAPLAQIGLDPTKNRPFLLFGGGFSIPVARIAFSGGPIWTWDQSLDKLSVGQIINSTTDLEKNIQYKFDARPKGWYFGIQYNF